jgi:hypothetical protein
MFLSTLYSYQRSALEDIQKMIRELQLDENRKRELATALHVQFKDWLYGNALTSHRYIRTSYGYARS